jgi:proteasome alpha subunit
MAITPYEWNESVRHRNEYLEDRLRDGSPVVALSYEGGVLILSVRQTQRKIYEIYDRLAFSAIGNQSDIETIRTGAIDVAHREGYTRSPDDVSIQRIVGFAVSPSIKKVYSDSYAAPLVMRAIFAELGKSSDRDHYYVVSYDGEFVASSRYAVVAGSAHAEDLAVEFLENALKPLPTSLNEALKIAIKAWEIGKNNIDEQKADDKDDEKQTDGLQSELQTASSLLSKGWVVEAAILERYSSRENRYRSLSADDIQAAFE